MDVCGSQYRRQAVVCSEGNGILLADILTRPRMSIIRQSFNCQERLRNPDPRRAYEVSSLNGDGFGVGWYVPLWAKPHLSIEQQHCPCVFTSLKPAWSDRNLVNIAENTISPLMFAHVRAAGPGSGWPSETNCHPFSYGRFLFMHNGTISNWTRVRGRFLSILSVEAFDYALSTGAIDSVAIFGIIISQMTKGGHSDYTPNELRQMLERTLAAIEEVCREEQVEEPSFLNIVLTDGRCVLAARHVVAPYDGNSVAANDVEPASLYFATGTKWGRDSEAPDSYRMVHTDKRNDIAIITSEALTDSEEEWVPVPKNHMLIVTPGIDVLLYGVPRSTKILAQLVHSALKRPVIQTATKIDILPVRQLPGGMIPTKAPSPELQMKKTWLPDLECVRKTLSHLNQPNLSSRLFRHAKMSRRIPYVVSDSQVQISEGSGQSHIHRNLNGEDLVLLSARTTESSESFSAFKSEGIIEENMKKDQVERVVGMMPQNNKLLGHSLLTKEDIVFKGSGSDVGMKIINESGKSVLMNESTSDTKTPIKCNGHLQSIAQSLDVLSTSKDAYADQSYSQVNREANIINPCDEQSTLKSNRLGSTDWDNDGRSGIGDNYSDEFICHSFLSATDDELKRSSLVSEQWPHVSVADFNTMKHRASLSSMTPTIQSNLPTAIPFRHWVATKSSAILSVACFSVWVDKKDPVEKSVQIANGTYHFHHREPYRYVVTGSQDGVIRVWDVIDGVCLRELCGIQGGVLCLLLVYVEALSTDSYSSMEQSLSRSQLLLFAGSSDTTITIWDLSEFLESPKQTTLTDTVNLTTDQSSILRSPYQHQKVTSISKIYPSSFLLCISFEPQQGDVLTLTLHHNDDGIPIIYAGFQTTVIGYLYLRDVLQFLRRGLNDISSQGVSRGPSTTLTLMSNRIKCKTKTSWHKTCFANIKDMLCSKIRKECDHNVSSIQNDIPSLECHLIHYGALARHCGFVESLVSCGPFLCSGGGDGLLLVWKNNSTLVGHRGGVLCLVASQYPELSLYSGSRDKSIRAWDLVTLSCRQTLKGHSCDVLCLALTHTYLVSGAANGEVFCWCRKTHVLLNCLLTSGPNTYKSGLKRFGYTSAITSLCVVPQSLKQSCDSFPMEVHERIRIASRSSNPSIVHHPCSNPRIFEDNDVQTSRSSSLKMLSTSQSENDLNDGGFIECEIVATGGDGALRLWRLENTLGYTSVRRSCNTTATKGDEINETIDKTDVDEPEEGQLSTTQRVISLIDRLSNVTSADLSNDFEALLREFVAFQSISGRPVFLEECWRAARFLSSCFEAVGACVKLLDVGTGYSPLVVARLGSDPKKPTVLFYSHYDVVPATTAWSLSPPDGRSRSELTSSPGIQKCSSDSFVRSPVPGSPFEVDYQTNWMNDKKTLCVMDSQKSPSCHSAMVTPRTSHWHTDPWQLTAMNGYYYGRGVTDNKGPILVQLFSVLGLQYSSRTQGIELPVNVIWLSEGEEESGSSGFEAAVQRLQEASDMLSRVRCVVCTNSYWVDDRKPCLVAGMRGVIDVTVSVDGGPEPYGHHSGVHGGAIAEPMLDLLDIISSLVDSSGKILIPGFYDDVDHGVRLDESLLKEKGVQDPLAYRKQVNNAGLREDETLLVLKRRWLEPVLSVTEIWSSNQEGSLTELGHTFRVIPSKASSNISIRCVPKQDIRKLISQLEDHLKSVFKSRQSPNRLTIQVTNAFDWWTGDVCSDPFRAALQAVEDVWNVRPLVVREGGTMPVIRFLQDRFGVPAIHLPIGQASDAAHLPNERIRIVNLKKGMDVLQKFFLNLAAQSKMSGSITLT